MARRVYCFVLVVFAGLLDSGISTGTGNSVAMYMYIRSSCSDSI